LVELTLGFRPLQAARQRADATGIGVQEGRMRVMPLVLAVMSTGLVAPSAASAQAPPPASAPFPSAAVEVEFDHAAAFPRYRSFDWAPDLEPLKNATNHRLLVSAVERALLAKGLTKAAAGQPPDALINFYARALGQLKPSTNETTAATRDPSKHGVVTTIARERVGTLAIELLDGISRQMVWRAMGSHMLGAQTETADQIDGYVTTLLASYPPDPLRP
jgi:hypothetical protein